ncbi:MAG: anhydro-N-acetylmuramic acid kinase [Rhodothermales bacterium]
MHPLQHLWKKETRLVAGLMSGTSLDGVDAVVARLSGSGRKLQIEVVGFVGVPYPAKVRALLLHNSMPETSSVYDLSQLNVRLAHLYADAVRQVVAAADLPLDALDLIGSHGQTVHHVPEAVACAGHPTTSTLQVGDPSVLATVLGVPVVGDFRVADMALGGQGAPLVPYFDYVYFSTPDETRGLLNLGGIANLTVLPRGGDPEAVYAFDTGPANMVIDALAQRFFDQPYDRNGALAGEGRIDPERLALLLEDPFFAQPPPKSTGRERFGEAFVDKLLHAGSPLSPPDLLATATMLTAASVYQAYTQFVLPRHALDVLIISGGGRHNRFLIHQLAARFAPVPVRAVDAYGLDSDAKEALCFAVLAHETINGVPTNLPSVTGASRRTLLGKICVPV